MFDIEKTSQETLTKNLIREEGRNKTMKPSKLLFALILLSISSVVIFGQSVTVNANPSPFYPSIIINSPTNSTYTSDTLTLDIEINTTFDSYTGTARTISYSLDGQPSVVINNVSYKYFDGNLSSTVTASTVLSNLTNGQHQLLVQAKYQYKPIYSVPREFTTPRPTETIIIQNYTSEASANFYVDTNNSNTSPTPTLPAATTFSNLPLTLWALVFVAIILSLITALTLTLFRKHRKTAKPS